MIGIKMNMPDSCVTCPFRCFGYTAGDEDDVCFVNKRQFTNKESKYQGARRRVDWCPLIDLNERKEGADDV